MFHIDALTTPARTLGYVHNDDYAVHFERQPVADLAGTLGDSDIVGGLCIISCKVRRSGGTLRRFDYFLNHPASVLVPDAFLTSASVVLPVAGMPSDAFICIFAGDADCKHKLFYVRVDRGLDRRDVVTHVRLGKNALCRLLQQAVDLERIERAMNVNLTDNEYELQRVDARISALEDLIDDWVK